MASMMPDVVRSAVKKPGVPDTSAGAMFHRGLQDIEETAHGLQQQMLCEASAIAR